MSQQKSEIIYEKLPHKTIIKYIDYYFKKNPYVSVSFGGVCYGFTAKYIDALVLEEQTVFFERLKILYDFQNDIPALFDIIEEIRTTIKGKHSSKFEELSYNEKNMLEIPAFLESIYIQQEPDQFKLIFLPEDSSNDYVISERLAQDFKKYHKFTAPLKLDDAQLIRTHKTIHMVTDDEFVNYLTKLKQQLIATDQHVKIKLMSRSHAIALSFNKKEACWELLDINHLILHDTENINFLVKSEDSNALARKAYAYLNNSLFKHKQIHIEFYQHSKDTVKKPFQPISTNPYYQFFYKKQYPITIVFLMLSLISLSSSQKLGLAMFLATFFVFTFKITDRFGSLSEKTYDFFKSDGPSTT